MFTKEKGYIMDLTNEELLNNIANNIAYSLYN